MIFKNGDYCYMKDLEMLDRIELKTNFLVKSI